MLKYLTILFLLCFPLVGKSSQLPTIGNIGVSTKVPDGDYVIIASTGGFISTSFILASQLSNKTCIVAYAQSAALQVLLPGCKERYYLDNAFLVFHGAGVVLESRHFTYWEARDLATRLDANNKDMANWMSRSGFPWPVGMILAGMEKETILKNKDILRLSPWIHHVNHCRHCPTWMKRLKNVKPAQ